MAKEHLKLMRQLEKYGAEVRVSLTARRGQTRPSSGSTKPTTPLASKIDSLRNNYGLTLAAIADELGELLQRRVPFTTVHSWNGGVTPREIPLEEIYQAIDAIKAKHVRFDEGIWVSAEEVEETLANWLTRLSRRQIAVAADESLSVINSWVEGRHRVQRPKWRRVVQQVEEVLAILPEKSD